MDLQLTDEQRWLAEAIDELLRRAYGAGWQSLVEFGAFDVGADGLGAVELALIARAAGGVLSPLPFADAAAVHYAVALGGATVAPCLAETGRPFAPDDPSATLTDSRLNGRYDAVPHAASVELFAVPALANGGAVLAIVPAAAAAVESQPTLDATVAAAQVHFADAGAEVAGDASAIGRVAAAAGILVSAEAVGAAASILELAREYAGQRRQFGRTIGSFQAVRHLLADMYVQLESAWSSVLYAAASLDEGEADAARTAAIAKAYAARATQEVAQGALQVFGGIAFTADHSAHRFLRRIVVRGGHYGSARDHERTLGQGLARTAP